MNTRVLFGSPSPSYASRRQFLRRSGAGFGLLALSSMLQECLANESAIGLGSGNSMLPKPPHFAAKAKSVIWLFMNGGQSQVDTYDYKPMLAKHSGQPLDKLDPKMAFFQKEVGTLLPSPFKFQQHRFLH